MTIEEMHPLRERAKLQHIIPEFKVCVDCCQKKQRKNFKHNLRKTLLEEMEIQMSKSEAQVQQDPFLMLGYGVNAYFDIMYSLVFMFLTISIACIPMYYNYAHNES